ncbi:nephrin-like isoform X2 [Tachypleus tridentatus]|uniref:nephrin-like isoform X2 n=1 Tax=Tachypleus tridentatus TaxID=6853 RepID=UPI003FD21484
MILYVLRPFANASVRTAHNGDSLFSELVIFISGLSRLVSSVFAAPVYQAVLGESAYIPCNISLPSEEDSVSLVLWCKRGINAPIISMDSRRGPLKNAKRFTSELLGQRAYFNVSEQQSVLIINRVEKDDEGDYRCRVDFRYGRTLNDFMTLDVIGNPPILVTWWRNSVLLDSSFQITEDQVVRNDFTLQELTRKDLMAKFTCQASNTNLTSPGVASVIVDINLKPMEIRLILSHQYFSASRQYVVECQTTGSRPPAHITWWLGSRKMEAVNASFREGGNKTVSNVVFSPSSRDNGKYLSCRAENHQLPGRALEDGIPLNVHYKPKVSVTLKHGQVAQWVQTGDDVYFYCLYDSNPEATKIEWQFWRGTLINNPRSGILVHDQSLILEKVGRAQSGTYRCLVDNCEGREDSEVLKLNIKYAPICKEGQKTRYTLTVHELAEVSCEVHADPDNVTFTWSINTSAGYKELLTFHSVGPRSVVRYVPRDEKDFGILTCKSHNVVGQQTEPCIYTLVAVGPPSPPESCDVSNTTNSMLLVRCNHGDDGGLQQSFHIEVYLLPNKKLAANLTNFNNPTFLLTFLPAGARLILLIYSSNSKGRSRPVTLMAHTLTPVLIQTNDQYQFSQRKTSYQETKRWMRKSLDYCTDNPLGLSLIETSRSKKLENTIPKQHKELVGASLCHRCLKVYPVREYKRYTQV